MMPCYRRHQRLLEVTILVMFAAYIFYELVIGKFFSAHIELIKFRDYGLIIDLMTKTVNNNRYEVGYFFPPPNLVLVGTLSRVGQDTSFRLFLALGAISFVVTFYFWSVVAGFSKKTERFIIVLCGFAGSLYYIRFEFQMHNLNLIGMGLLSWQVYLLKRTCASGVVFGLGTCLKPYGSVLLLPWMLWKGQLRWCLAAILAVLVIGLVVPALWFGLSDTGRLYREWLASVASTSDPAFVRASGQSLRAGVAALLGIDPYAPIVGLVTHLAELTWLVMLATFFFVRRRADVTFGLPMAAEVAALLMVPLPIGYQQPARMVVLLVATLVLAAAALDTAREARTRYALWTSLLLVGTIPWVVPLGPAHCVVTLVVCVLSLVGLSIAAPAPDPTQGNVANAAV